MPEIAEVEVIKNDLKISILGEKISRVEVFTPGILSNILKDAFIKKLVCSTIFKITRYGKYLIFHLNKYFLIVHLRMTGHVFVKDMTYRPAKHDHIIITFTNNKKLIYFDPRRFGKFYLRKSLSMLDRLGTDILSEKFTFDTFYQKIKIKKQKIKTLLLDQSFIAGLGNIYVNEVLFLAKIHPEKLANSLNKNQTELLFKSIKEVISKAIENRGTSLGTSRSNFTSIKEDFGSNQNFLFVHTKKKCPVCLNNLAKIKVSQRSSYFCKKCQKI